MDMQFLKNRALPRKNLSNAQDIFQSRFLRSGKSRDEEIIAICDAMTDLLGACFMVPTGDLRSQDRAVAPVARVRQIGMYVCHVALNLSMAEVAKGFGRDRTTVIHACHLVEDLRDDMEFDRVCTRMERIARAAFGLNQDI